MPRAGGLLSYRSVAELLDCSEDTIRRLVKKALLPKPQKYEGVGIRFQAMDVYLYIARQAEKVRSRTPQEDANRPRAEGS